MPARIAFFVSPHGFGHAARAAAVMAALSRASAPRLAVVTTVPRWFFEDSLAVPFDYHEVAADVGLVQRGPLAEDLDATVAALSRFWSEAAVERAARLLDRERVDLVVADVSPLGLAAAARRDVPAVLVENFTWDWIYEPLVERTPGLAPFARRFAELAAGASLRLQAEPVCRPHAGGRRVGPIARAARLEPGAARRRLDVAADRPLLLLAMGGLGWAGGLPPAAERADLTLVTLGGRDRLERARGLVRLPDRPPLYVPDLVAAADAVVGKLGYSTVVECHRHATRLAWTDRPGFRETPVLAAFARRHLAAVELPRAAVAAGAWLPAVRELLASPAPAPDLPDGAERAAAAIAELL